MSRAAVYDRLGSPDVMRVVEVEDVGPRDGEVAIRVEAAGLNPYDTKVRTGINPSIEPFPRRIGVDVAGRVAAVGEGATYSDGTPVRPGDDVLGWGHGTVAERVVVASSQLARRPAGLSVAAAGGLYVSGLTALSCLVTAGIGHGDRVLVGGATGAVGLVAVQLAVAAGADVVGTAAADNHDLLHSLGAVAVEYGNGLALRIAKEGAITAVIDCHGTDAAEAGLALGVSPSRIVGIAARDRLSELGVLVAEREARTAKNLSHLAGEIEAGRIAFPIAREFALDEVQDAYRLLERRHEPGKVLIRP